MLRRLPTARWMMRMMETTIRRLAFLSWPSAVPRLPVAGFSLLAFFCVFQCDGRRLALGDAPSPVALCPVVPFHSPNPWRGAMHSRGLSWHGWARAANPPPTAPPLPATAEAAAAASPRTLPSGHSGKRPPSHGWYRPAIGAPSQAGGPAGRSSGRDQSGHGGRTPRLEMTCCR